MSSSIGVHSSRVRSRKNEWDSWKEIVVYYKRIKIHRSNIELSGSDLFRASRPHWSPPSSSLTAQPSAPFARTLLQNSRTCSRSICTRANAQVEQRGQDMSSSKSFRTLRLQDTHVEGMQELFWSAREEESTWRRLGATSSKISRPLKRQRRCKRARCAALDTSCNRPHFVSHYCIAM